MISFANSVFIYTTFLCIVYSRDMLAADAIKEAV